MIARCSIFHTALLSVAGFSLHAIADDFAQGRERRLEAMHSIASETAIVLENSPKITLHPEPLIRYADVQRGFSDATLWVYLRDGRPVALQKIEAKLPNSTLMLGAAWGICLTSCAPELIEAGWTLDNAPKFRATAPGLSWASLKAPTPPASDRQRQVQSKRLAGQFTARIIEAVTGEESEMRLLSKPLFEYSDPATGRYLGSMFGFTTLGTNPDLVVLLELAQNNGQTQWNVAALRMTNGGVLLLDSDRELYRCDPLRTASGILESWLFFDSPRTVESDETR